MYIVQQVCPDAQHLQSRFLLQLHDVIFNISCEVNGLFLLRFGEIQSGLYCARIKDWNYEAFYVC